MPRGPIRNLGVNALARELGLHPVTVSRKMTQGKTVEQIRAEAVRERMRGNAGPRMRMGARKHVGQPGALTNRKDAPPPAPVPTLPIGYTPARVRMNARVGLVPDADANVRSVAQSVSVTTATAEDLTSYEEAKLRKAWADAKLAEAKHAKLSGELVPTRIVNAFFTQQFIDVNKRLRAIGPECRDRLAACEDPVECDRIVTAAVEEALGKLAVLDNAVVQVEENGDGDTEE